MALATTVGLASLTSYRSALPTLQDTAHQGTHFQTEFGNDQRFISPSVECDKSVEVDPCRHQLP